MELFIAMVLVFSGIVARDQAIKAERSRTEISIEADLLENEVLDEVEAAQIEADIEEDELRAAKKRERTPPPGADFTNATGIKALDFDEELNQIAADDFDGDPVDSEMEKQEADKDFLEKESAKKRRAVDDMIDRVDRGRFK